MFCLLESIGGFAETPNAFVFSLNNFEKLAPFMSKVKPEKTKRAIYSHSFFGPVFGQDLVIQAERKSSSEARLDLDYPVPPSVTDKFTILAGLRYFLRDEVEVFCLDPSS